MSGAEPMFSLPLQDPNTPLSATKRAASWALPVSCPPY